MKRTFSGRIRRIAVATGIVCAGLSVGLAVADSEEIDIWRDALIHPFDSIVLTEQQIDRFLERLSQTNPERVAELEKLRIAYTTQFRWEIREEMANRFFDRIQPADPTAPDRAAPVVPAEPPTPLDEAMLNRKKTLIAWLEANFPPLAEELKSHPSLSVERLTELFARYDPIIRAERSNPPLAQAMRDDLQVQIRRDELLIELPYADAEQRQAITQELQELVARRFDLIVLKRRLQHDHLRRRLDRLLQELDTQKQELETLKTAKDSSVKARVEELLKNADSADWD